MGDDNHRTPIVRIELQLLPQPPDDAEPYWWGNHVLTFKVRGLPVWEAHVPEAEWSTFESARVARRGGFGWVLVLTLGHDKARQVLDRLALPAHIDRPDAAAEKGHGHASRWSYWSGERADA